MKRPSHVGDALIGPAWACTAFIGLSAGFFASIGRDPWEALQSVLESAAGSSYAIGESLLRATPILLCALATLVPARLGLVSVGAEGQMYAGALCGTGAMLLMPHAPGPWLLLVTLAAGIAGGALWGGFAAVLRVAAQANETISTLLLNYVASLLVTWLVYGPWKDPHSQGWPSTIEFAAAARLPLLGSGRLHAGLPIAIAAAVALHVLFTRSRWGLGLDVMRGNPRAGRLAGLDPARQILWVMCVGGALAGLAGIVETSTVQGRLQAGLANGAGLSGFMVAWLARRDALAAIGLSLLIGALLAAGDGLQMTSGVPSSATLVMQGLLFTAVLGVGGWRARRAATRAGEAS